MSVDNLNGFIAVEGIDGSGKSTIVKRLHNLLIANDRNVYSFSISDLCKTGHVDKQIDLNYEDLVKFDFARNIVLKTLKRIKEIKDDSSEECILCYDKLMMDYFSVMRVYSYIVKAYLNKGFVVIADRWFLSSLAYNNIVPGTEFNKIFTFRGYNYKPLLRIDESKDDGDIFNYKLNHLKNNFISVLEPDITFYIDLDPEEAIKRIKKRDKSIDYLFETKSKLTAVHEAYKYILDTYRNVNDDYTYLFNMDRHLVLDGMKTTNDILMDIIK